MSERTIDIELKVRIRYDVIKGHPGRWYLKNGDPGYTPEPDEFDIIHVFLNNHDILPFLTDDDIELILEKLDNQIQHNEN